MRVLVLQHIACEPPGVFEDLLHERSDVLTRVEVDEGEPLPDWRAFDAIVAMGGPMGAYDEAAFPWLADEKRLIAEAVRGGTPFFGVCLGAQLLASALGARVYAGGQPEVGILPIEVTEAGSVDRVIGGLPSSFPTLQWHGDTFDLPEGAELLASSSAYPNQVFRVGDSAYGVQFHIEVTDDMAAEWGRVPAYAASLEKVRGPGALDALLAEFAGVAPDMREHARMLFESWLILVVDARVDRAAANA
jgi:GMP synthase (glutamine-hydrolysing)